MIRGGSLSLMAMIAGLAGGALTMPLTGQAEGAGRFRWERNSFFEARRQGRRRAQRNRRKAARS